MRNTPQPRDRDGDDEPLLTSTEVAKWLGISPSTLCRMRERGDGPKVFWITDTTPRYRPADVREWLETRKAA